MLKIGLTGGIGSGKSTVTQLFKDLFNIPIIDADIIAHQLVSPNQPALSLLQDAFGPSIIFSDGSLDRKMLSKIIYSDSNKKQLLENILHPLIFQKMQIELDQQSSTYCILCIPLLIETNMIHFVDHILVIDCPIEQQISRVISRDSLSQDHILSIINSQVSRETRLSKANTIINNSDSSSLLAEQVKNLHNEYILLSNLLVH